LIDLAVLDILQRITEITKRLSTSTNVFECPVIIAGKLLVVFVSIPTSREKFYFGRNMGSLR